MCTAEEGIGFEQAMLHSSPLVSAMLGLGKDEEEEEYENQMPEPTGGAAGGVNGEREIGIIPLTYNFLLHPVQYQPSSKGLVTYGPSLLDKIKVKRSPERSDESNPGSVGTVEEGSPNGSQDRTCTKCNRTFLRRCDYNKHMNSHAGQRKYQCPMCFKEFTRTNHVYRHMAVHYAEKLKKSQAFQKTKKEVNKRKRAKPVVEPERNLGLKESGSGAEDCVEKGAAGLKVPAVRAAPVKQVGESPSGNKKVPNGARPLHQCNVCSKLFKHRKLLRQHLQNHPTHPCTCVLCLKAFASNEELSQHRRNHQQYRPHKCTICSKTFVRASHLKRHMGLHTKDRILECSVCGKQFTNSRNYQSHVDSHARNAAREAKRKAAKPRSRSNNKNNTTQRLPPKNCLPVPMEVSEDFQDDGPLDLSKNSPMLRHYVSLSSNNQQPSRPDAGVENHKLRLPLTLSPTKSLRVNGHVSVQSSSQSSGRRREGPILVPHNNHGFLPHQGLLQRQDTRHPDISPYLCQPCDLFFWDEASLLEHAVANHERPNRL